MVEILSAASLVPAGALSRTARFDGAEHGAEASFFYVDNDPGQGPGLHWHPYSETWIVIEGTPLFTVGVDGGAEDAEAAAEENLTRFTASVGDIATVPARTAHAFSNAGPGPMRLVCIHAGPRIVQFDLEPVDG